MYIKKYIKEPAQERAVLRAKAEDPAITYISPAAALRFFHVCFLSGMPRPVRGY